MHQMFPAFHLPEHVGGRGALRSTGLRGLRLPLKRGHSVGQGGGRPPGVDSAGAEGPDTLPPMPRGEGAGAEGPDTPSPAPAKGPSSAASGERRCQRP